MKKFLIAAWTAWCLAVFVPIWWNGIVGMSSGIGNAWFATDVLGLFILAIITIGYYDR